jgi:hypothetical protein
MNALVARVVQRFRVAQRYLAARGLPMGKTFQNENVRIHRFREVLKVTDLTNAGKRGKSCTEVTMQFTADFEGDRDEFLDAFTDMLMEASREGFDTVRRILNLYHRDDRRGQIALDYQQLKSINVEPFGEIFEFTIKQPGQASIDVKVSPTDFSVVNHAWMTHPTDPSVPGFIHDSRYYPVKKKDAMAFYAWMKENHERARRFMNMDMFRKVWTTLGVKYDYH